MSTIEAPEPGRIENFAANVGWRKTGTVWVKPPQDIPFGPGHKPRAVRHAGGPEVTYSVNGEVRGTLAPGDYLLLDDATQFTVEPGTGTGLLEMFTGPVS